MMLKALLVILAVLMALQQASGQEINIDFNIGGKSEGSDTSEESQDIHIDSLLRQVKEQAKDLADVKNQVKNLAVDLCRARKADCCNKTTPCPSGYEWFCEKLDKCYKFSTDMKNYTDAKSACQAAGGRLAMPKDMETDDFLVKQIQDRYKFEPNVWIGLSDQASNGIWVWEDGKTLGSGWNNWVPIPESRTWHMNKKHSACVFWELWDTQEYIWDSQSCSNTFYYVCEVEATSIP